MNTREEMKLCAEEYEVCGTLCVRDFNWGFYIA